jgi:hypothetical protein
MVPERRLLLLGPGRFFSRLVHAAIARGELPLDTDVPAVTGLIAAIMWGTGLYSGFVRDADLMAAIARQIDDLFSHGLPMSYPAVVAPRASFG